LLTGFCIRPTNEEKKCRNPVCTLELLVSPVIAEQPSARWGDHDALRYIIHFTKMKRIEK
jgi:hypothetical protein